jgi:biuret amidohydrolase
MDALSTRRQVLQAAASGIVLGLSNHEVGSAAEPATGTGAIKPTLAVPAEPYEFCFEPATTALLVIDMQRDFVLPGGFGELLGNNVALLKPAIEPTRRVLHAFRSRRLTILHTREGHRPDLSDCPPTKRARGKLKVGIGDRGPMGRVLVRGEHGHGMIDQLAPLPSEPVIDKPGKGAFFATDLDLILKNLSIRSLIVTGVTTEVCVQTSVREANDRGYECLVLEDCVASYFPEFHCAALEMIKAQGGIVGWVSSSDKLLAALNTSTAV